jgi:REP element-mobilizing transposase RayT
MVIAYMLTWTTYGTWLQGDRRGWMKNATIYSPNHSLEKVNRKRMKAKQVTLTKEQRMWSAQAIVTKAAQLKQKIFALAVCDNHIHLVLQNINLPIGRVVSHYKHAVRLALQRKGFNGKLWTGGFDKRYCMNDKELDGKVSYIQTHKNIDAEIIVSLPIHSAGYQVR